MSVVTIVGVGPGSPQYVTPRVQHTVAVAELVAGFAPVLVVVKTWLTGRVLCLDYQTQDAQLAELANEAAQGRRCVICAWGDPSFSARELVERVRRLCPDVVLEPGISSVQVACARAGLEMERSTWVTLHARAGADEALGELVEVIRAATRHAIVLPRPWDLMPPALAAQLIERGVIPTLPAIVYERLTLAGEREHRLSLGALALSRHDFSDLSLLLIPAPRSA